MDLKNLFPKLVDRSDEISLSDSDLLKICNNNIKIYTYTSLFQFNDIDDLFTEYDYIIILYQMRKMNSGHWVSIYRDEINNTLVYFNPYGKKVDFEISLPDSFVKRNYLTELINKSLHKYKLDINTYKFQLLEKDMNTCGRHVAVRYFFRNYSNREYKEILDATIKRNNYKNADELVTCLTILYTLEK